MVRVVKPAAPEPIPVADEPESVLLLPLDGEEVLFHSAGGRRVLAEVGGREDNGELWLLCDLGDELVTQRATHSSAEHGWLTYNEAAKVLKRDAV